MSPENRWQKYGDVWGVEIQAGMRARDLPEWFAPCLEAGGFGLTPLRFEKGSFVLMTWTTTPDGNQQAARTVLQAGDVLLALDDGGVSVRFADTIRAWRIKNRQDGFRRAVWDAYTEARQKRPDFEKHPRFVLRCAEFAMLGKSESYETPYFRARTEAVARDLVWC